MLIAKEDAATLFLKVIECHLVPFFNLLTAASSIPTAYH